MIGRSFALACVAAGIAACGETRVVGIECPDGGCALANGADAGCSAEFALQAPDPALLPSGFERTRCEVFTLGPLGSGRMYLSHIHARMLPVNHQLDISIAREAPGIADGPVDCDEIYQHQIAWVPIVASDGDTQDWGFEDTLIASDARQRLLISDHFFNGTSAPVEVVAEVKLDCTRARTRSRVNQIFALETRTPYVVPPGASYSTEGSCSFPHGALISYLGTPIAPALTEFAVSIDAGKPFCTLADTRDCPGVKHAAWSIASPRTKLVAAGHTLDWRCSYQNVSDLAIAIGGDSGTVCSLFGMYAREDAVEDTSPLRCVLP